MDGVFSLDRAMSLSGGGVSLYQQVLALAPAVLLDPSQMGTLFQERTGASATTPAVVNGPVGTMRNLGAQGGYFVAPSDAGRPTLRNSGALYWLEFDGVNDRLSMAFTVTQPFVRISAVDPDRDDNDQTFGGVTANAGALYMSAANQPAIYSGNAMSGPTTIGAGVHVFEERHNNLSGRLRWNAWTYANGTSGADLPGGVSIGGSTSANTFSRVDFYGMAMFLSDIGDAAIDVTTRWAALRGGVTLHAWLPAAAVLHVDFENSRFYWDRQVRQLSDLTSIGGGVYDLLNYGSFAAGNEATFAVDYAYDNDLVANVPSGNIFSWSDGSQRVELEVFDAGAGRKTTRLYSPMTTPEYAYPRYSHPDDTGTLDGVGRRRVQFALKAGEYVRAMADDYLMATDDHTVLAALTQPTRIRFGGRARFQDQPLVNGTLYRVTIWPTARTQAQMDAHAVNGVAGSYHLDGDSFLNLHKVEDQIAILHKARGYIGKSQNNLGGTSISQHVTRLLTVPKWLASKIVIVEGGFDGTAADAQTALNTLQANLSHSYWALTESAPQFQLPGSPGRTTFDGYMTSMAAYCGADHWIPTLAPLRNTNAGSGTVYHDGSANDLADIANQLWPRSLQADPGVDFHPGSTPNSAGWSGQEALAHVIYLWMVSKGWLPA